MSAFPEPPLFRVHPFKFLISPARFFTLRYDTFWSCCDSKEHTGFNGVATFARTGLTLSGDSRPLSKYLSPELNAEGRAILTRHPGFSLLNVYTPNSGARRQRLESQVSFLEACKQCLRAERKARGVPVIMGGDFNLTYRGIDRHWKWRMVNVANLLQLDFTKQPSPRGSDDTLEKNDQDIVGEMAVRFRTHFDTVLAMLKTAKMEPFESTNAKGKKVPKFRVRANGSKGKVLLGSPSDNEDDWSNKMYLQFKGDVTKEEEATALSECFFVIGALAECFEKAVGVPWGSVSQLVAFADRFGLPTSPAICQEWMKSMLSPKCGEEMELETEQENMIDAFASLRPSARSRFTCWEQYRNKRYVNEGSRIDYFIIDPSLFKLVATGGPLSCGEENQEATVLTDQPASSLTNPDSAEAALLATTACGLWQAASFEGGGMNDAPKKAYERQFCKPHTGSNHIFLGSVSRLQFLFW